MRHSSSASVPLAARLDIPIAVWSWSNLLALLSIKQNGWPLRWTLASLLWVPLVIGLLQGKLGLITSLIAIYVIAIVSIVRACHWHLDTKLRARETHSANLQPSIISIMPDQTWAYYRHQHTDEVQIVQLTAAFSTRWFTWLQFLSLGKKQNVCVFAAQLPAIDYHQLRLRLRYR